MDSSSTVNGAREQSSNNDIIGIVPPDISFDLPVVTCEFVLNEINRIPVKKLLARTMFLWNYTALLWQKEASDIPSKFELLMFS